MYTVVMFCQNFIKETTTVCLLFLTLVAVQLSPVALSFKISPCYSLPMLLRFFETQGGYRVAQIKIPHRTKCNFLTNSLNLNPLDYHVWELCLNATSHFNPSRRTSMSSRKFCSWYGTSCHSTRSTKQYWASRKDFGLVWKLVVDTSNIH